MCVCTKRGHVRCLFLYHSLFTLFFEVGSLIKPDLVISAGLLGPVSPRPLIPTCSVLRLQTHIAMWVWGSKVRFSGLCSRHFAKWATSSVLNHQIKKSSRSHFMIQYKLISSDSFVFLLSKSVPELDPIVFIALSRTAFWWESKRFMRLALGPTQFITHKRRM